MAVIDKISTYDGSTWSDPYDIGAAASNVSCNPVGTTSTTNVQLALNYLNTKKQDTIGGAASSVVRNNLEKNRILISDGNGKIAASEINTNIDVALLNNIGTKEDIDSISQGKTLTGIIKDLDTQLHSTITDLNSQIQGQLYSHAVTIPVSDNISTSTTGYLHFCKIGKMVICNFTLTVAPSSPNKNTPIIINSSNYVIPEKFRPLRATYSYPGGYTASAPNEISSYARFVFTPQGTVSAIFSHAGQREYYHNIVWFTA